MNPNRASAWKGRTSTGAIPFARPDIDDSDYNAIARVLDSGWLTTGDECRAFEDELEQYLGARHVVAVSSCTAALEIALVALGLGAGARVGVPTWTFASTALVPSHAGAMPVLLDVDEATLNLSPVALERALDEGLDAVVAVHFGGVPVDSAVHRLCRAAGVPLIEDAAHALGARDERGLIGTSTLATCFSFYATKNLSCGEGGALVSDDEGTAEFARSYRLHGLSNDAWARYRPGGRAAYDLVHPGIKANLPDLLAALARSQLARFDELQARRRRVVLRYRSGLAEVADVTPVPAEAAPGSADHLFVVALAENIDRDGVVDFLAARGIGTSIHFRPLHQFAWFAQHAAVGPAGVGTAARLANRVLSLPLHSQLDDADVDRVCEAVAEATTACRAR